MAASRLSIIKLEHTDSTSSEVSRRLQSGENSLPFAVIARSQSQGRGRRGRSWQSPAGNLYFSLALDGHYIQDHNAPLSLRVGVAIAEWLRDSFSIYASLKWPNDLLFGPAKLGGILVEAATIAEQSSYVIIGIGLNLHVAPSGLDQISTSIANIIGRDQLRSDVISYGEQCVRHLIKALNSEHWRMRFDEFSLQPGQVFKHEDHYYAFDGLEADGSLRLSPWQAGGKPLICTSVFQTVRWLYQDLEQPLVTIDAGNSQCKIYLYDTASSQFQPRKHWFVEYDEAEKLRSILQELREQLTHFKNDLPFPFPVYVASVNDRSFKNIKEQFNYAGLRPIFLRKRPVRVDFSAYDIRQMGIDRIALCEGASLSYPNENLLLVSCGTANTVEAVDRNRVYRGGWILPGLATKWRSLADHTAGLPTIAFTESWQYLNLQERLGHQTKEAIVRGAIWETVGGLKELQNYLEQTTGETWRLILTGGWSRLIATAMGLAADELLLARGIASLALGGSYQHS